MALISKRTAFLVFCLLLLPARNGFSSIHIEFDYSLDENGYFSGDHIGRRKLLEEAARPFEDRILDNFSAITPSGVDTWKLVMWNPSNSDPALISDRILPENTIIIYVGARNMGNGALAYSSGAAEWSGTAPFRNLIESRNTTTNYDSVGGSIAFEINANFYFDDDPSTLEPFPDQFDFYSTVQHEIGHILGFSSGAKAFQANRSNGTFVGHNATALYGGPIPLSAIGSHFDFGVALNGQSAAMVPYSNPNQRIVFSELDFAVLQDIGYSIKPLLVTMPTTSIALLSDGLVYLTWLGGTGPFLVQTKSSISEDWVNVNQNVRGRSATVWPESDTTFFRILDLQGH